MEKGRKVLQSESCLFSAPVSESKLLGQNIDNLSSVSVYFEVTLIQFLAISD